jgi:cytochrome c nitrite reductase small subunit
MLDGQAQDRSGVRLAIVGVLLGILVGASAHTFVYAEGFSYLSDDPRACVNCHVMREQYDGWQKASHHAAATCNDCHTPHDPVRKYLTKVDHGWRHSKGFTLDDFHEPIRITPKDLLDVRENCIRCHLGTAAEMVRPGSSTRFEDSADCVHCHANVGHGPRR